jgi:hypothetical protein
MPAIPVSTEWEEVKFDSLDIEVFNVLLLTTLHAMEGRLRMPEDVFMGIWFTQSLICNGSELMVALFWAM